MARKELPTERYLPLLHVQIFRLSATNTEMFYRHRFTTIEFFYRRRFTTKFFLGDIDAVLSNQLSLRTYLTVEPGFRWEGIVVATGAGANDAGDGPEKRATPPRSSKHDDS